jgi:hypothetical protein
MEKTYVDFGEVVLKMEFKASEQSLIYDLRELHHLESHTLVTRKHKVLIKVWV